MFSDYNTMPILDLLMHCIRQSGSRLGSEDPNDPAHEVVLVVLVETLTDGSFGVDFPRIPTRRHKTLLTTATHCLKKCLAPRPSPLVAASNHTPPPIGDTSKHCLSDA